MTEDRAQDASSEAQFSLPQKALFALISIPALWQLALLATAVLARLTYPFDLEWMEGGLLDHAARIQEGTGVYTPPSVDFVSYLYTPLYPAVLALGGHAFGLGYTLGRAVSVISLVISLVVIVMAASPGKRRISVVELSCGVLACGLVAAGYPWLEGWYDLVRGDSMFVAMVLAGLFLLSRWQERVGKGAHVRIAIVAALLAMSFFGKQIGIFFVAAGGFNLLLWRRWRLIPTYIASAGIVGLGMSAILWLRTDGWFWTYVYEVFQTHDFNYDRFYQGFRHIAGRTIVSTIILIAALFAILLRLAARKKLPLAATRFLFWLPPYGAAVFAGATAWGHQWAHFNAYMSAIFVGAAATAAGLVAIIAILHSVIGRAATWLALVLPAALAIQLISQPWSPSKFIPTSAEVAKNQRLIERLEAIDGDIFIPYHSWYARLAGKETYAHRMGLMDVRFKNKLPVEGFAETFKEKRFAAVILNKHQISFALGGLKPHYRIDAVLAPTERARTFTGAITSPTTVWIPNGPPPPLPDGADLITDFEDGYRHFTATGRAWGNSPRRGGRDPRKPGLGYDGRFYARSSMGGDAATGTLSSKPFEITGPRITARIGGGSSIDLAATLVLDGITVRSATGSGSDALFTIEWNVAEFIGKRATIVLVDQDVRGHLSADSFWMWTR